MKFPIKYKNGDTFVTIHSDGTKERDIRNGTNAEFPESMDVKITNWCDAGCNFCHEKSTVRGLHADLQPTIDLLKQLPAGVEIAIGGGHPLSHPEFDNFVKEISDHGIICNVTINEYHFKKERERIESLIADKLIYGVGYSYKHNPCDFVYDNLVTHVIIGVTPYAELEKIIQYNNKILLLGFKKNTGRGGTYYRKHDESVDENIRTWYAGLFHAARKAHVSFDNLAISQLNPSRLFSNQQQYDAMFMGADGAYSMYLDAVKQEFSIGSTGLERFKYLSDIREMFICV
jgi:organic radical activating enzyme